MNRHAHEPSDERGAGRLASSLRRALQSAITEDGLSDPRVEGCMISVLDAAVAPDRSTVRFKVSVLPGERGLLAIAALRHAAGRLKEGMYKKIEIRRMPRLEFELDDSLKRQAALDAAMQAAKPSNGQTEVNDSAPHDRAEEP
ncbi:MAG: ribosome-binding factor A [Planctomycetes bacterium]|nr:ribosome-binding factor A [Planctomycetota bacterium]